MIALESTHQFQGIYHVLGGLINPLAGVGPSMLNIDSLDSLKQKLTKVIIVALIVTAFKVMVSFQVSSITELLQYCGGVLMLAFSSWLIGRTGKH